MNITITTVVPFRMIGIYDNGGVWTQASGVNLAEALAVLDEIPTATGIWTGTIYADGETLYAPDTTSDLEVEYFAYLDGETTATLETISDATVEILMTMTGETLIQNNHGRSFERRLPTGLAWHGEKNKAMLKGLGYEYRRKQIEINEVASIENMLFGQNMANWQKVLRLTASGTIAEQEQAIIRKLSDIGGLTAADLTRELHNAGFTTLYAYANKFDAVIPALQMGLDVQMGEDVEFAQKRRWISIDPRQYQFIMPYNVLGLDTQMGLDLQMGYNITGADLVANSSESEDALWSDIQPEEIYWKNYIFICGSTFGSIVDIDSDRRKELRKLILTIKPFKTWALMLINYV